MTREPMSEADHRIADARYVLGELDDVEGGLAEARRDLAELFERGIVADDVDFQALAQAEAIVTKAIATLEAEVGR